jgi:hypothetical protein
MISGYVQARSYPLMLSGVSACSKPYCVYPEVSVIVEVSQVLKVFFVSAPRFDEGESDICGMRAGRGNASHKPSTHKWQRAKALGADTKRFYLFLSQTRDLYLSRKHSKFLICRGKFGDKRMKCSYFVAEVCKSL